MSWHSADDPIPGDHFSCDAIQTLIVPRSRDLGSFAVRRALPSAECRMVGPFIFFDQMGPSEFLLGTGMDVRPHPHIGLSTVTYLFDGEIMHRDSLGTELPIRPGELNWMTAGPRHHPFRAHRAGPPADRLEAVRHPELGRAAAARTRRRRRPSSTTMPRRCRS